MAVIELPGLVDVHVHLREPGGVNKEDLYTGTCAALHGGIVTVLDMPNNSPPTVDASTYESKRAFAARKAVCDYGLFVGASTDNSQYAGHVPACGLKMYLNETFGPLALSEMEHIVSHFRNWPKGRPIAVHAEGPMVAVALALGRLYSQHVHVCHVSRRTDIELIRKAKERGWQVTCEVTPHHLFLSEKDADRLGPLAYMRPTLGSPDDRESLWENMAVVDAIASDHAPHTIEDKRGPQAPPGVPGLETMLPLLLTAVSERRLDVERLAELTSEGPARIYGIRRDPLSVVEVDTSARYEIRGNELLTKCRWTPFEGYQVQGRVMRTRLHAAVAFESGTIRVQPGVGRFVGTPQGPVA